MTLVIIRCVYVYPYSNWRKRLRERTNGRARPGVPSDPPDRPGSPQVARLRRFERQKSTESLGMARDSIFDDFGSILESILWLFEATSRERRDSQREGPNLDFDWQARYFGAFADFTETLKIDQNRRNIAPTRLRERAARPKLIFFAPGCDLTSILVA